MKKNGFLSVSTVFAFFLVFLSLMLYIILSMSNNRFLLDKMKETIKSELIEKEDSLANYVKKLYTGTQGENGLYYHNSGLPNGAGDNSYRYAGANPNNYVCFGSYADICPDDNLYRIIGVFGSKVKLIKWDYATETLLGTDGGYNNTYQSVSSGNWGVSKGSNAQTVVGVYYWNETDTNIWSSSMLNITNLNTNYLVNIGSVWEDKIADMTWIVGGNTWTNVGISAMNVAYQKEIVIPAENTTYMGKIGLMYVSDYGYAASPTYWKYPGYSSNAASDFRASTTSNWMYMGLLEWTITRQTDNSKKVFRVDSSGSIHYDDAKENIGCVRPVFYLNSDVARISGTGTKADPIRLGV